NPPQILIISEKIAVEGGHFQYVLDELLNYFHQITVYQNIGDHNALLSPSAEIKTVSQQFSAEDIQLFYQIALKGREEIHLAPTLVIGFNMTMLRMLTFRPAPNVTTLSFSHINETPPLCVEGYTSPKEENSLEESTNILEKVLKENISTNAVPKEEKPVIANENQRWADIIPHLKLTGLALNAIENTELLSREGRNVVLRVARGYQSLFTPTLLKRIETALARYYQGPIKIILNSDQSVQSSPAQQKEQATQHTQQKTEAALHNDPMFQQLKQEFSAELVKNSIVPLKDDL
ncbi:DNA polymerase III subunit gamma/tau C-terminal domain-containing protein, partial [Legionella sp.]|uniref:DNA polymerase III subunit gamma/tau C-terminal domain-containing protein n=1 Tax=Legionella sp. TaxID=459 RepID=UPI003CC47A40